MLRRIQRVTVLLMSCVAVAIARQSSERPSSMLSAYAANRDQGVGNYITHDLVLLGHVLCLEEAATQAEESLYWPQVRSLVDDLAEQAAKATESPVTHANRQFLAVLKALENGKSPESGPIKEEVEKVLATRGIDRSNILPENIDYSQFRIRGNYTRSPELGRYFQTVRYASTVLFAVKESRSTGIEAKDANQLTEQALQLAGWIVSSPKAAAAYKSYVHETGLLFGEPDDLTLDDVLTVRRIQDPAHRRAALLRVARKHRRQPQILGGLIDLGKLEHGVTAQDALTGWRMFPQRRSPDGAAFQQLIFPNVGEYRGNRTPRSMDVINGKKVKAFPQALELPALWGSASAVQALDATDERNYQGYEAASARARKLLVTVKRPASWLPAFQQLLSEKASPNDSPQQLTATALAYWTRNRHRSLLYEKQSYTPVVKGIALAPARTSAYLEPSIAVYKALLAQTQAIAPALKPETADALKKILATCVEIASKEASGSAPDSMGVSFLNDLDLQFLKIAGREDTPVVVDVHTNPASQQVLEEAVGYPLLVEFKPAGATAALHGARLTHFEFRQPMDRRMTDEEWQTRARDWKEHD